MKTMLAILALSLTSAISYAAPVNTTCPVAGKPAKDSVTTKHEGKDVAFCCNGCKGKFEADPAKYADKVKKD
ncbi:YHS domain-containing protein [Phragmitibacter flavus]|uniref:YHS domain-containing protein n=2 Tax=Phragmitibacter flavus TaxID=2576071 RepID=A0A5R8KGJ4_9BACT|nr:YHS domain-containing protein [Phragmitibacter flavus]